jgi:hypothetical protein
VATVAVATAVAMVAVVMADAAITKAPPPRAD